jgi:hypothetical protein
MPMRTPVVKATSNLARPLPRTGEIAIFANFTKPAGSFSPLLFCLFNLLRNGPPLAPGVAERDVTYRLESDDSIMFSDLRKV